MHTWNDAGNLQALRYLEAEIPIYRIQEISKTNQCNYQEISAQAWCHQNQHIGIGHLPEMNDNRISTCLSSQIIAYGQNSDYALEITSRHLLVCLSFADGSFPERFKTIEFAFRDLNLNFSKWSSPNVSTRVNILNVVNWYIKIAISSSKYYKLSLALTVVLATEDPISTHRCSCYTRFNKPFLFGEPTLSRRENIVLIEFKLQIGVSKRAPSTVDCVVGI